MIVDENVYLEHFGVKGMRWGVRKEQQTSESHAGTLDNKKNWKKAATITGAAVGLAAIAVGSIYAKKHYGISVSDLPATPTKASDFSKAMIKEPVGIVHAARGKNKGFTFPQHGGLSEPLREYDAAGLQVESSHVFNRYGNRKEKIGARFMDPEGRKDFAGRPIFHDVMLPESLAKHVTQYEDVQRIAWPLIKDVYNAFYD